MPILHDLVKAKNNVERLVELLRAGEDPNITNEYKDTPLHLVAFRHEENPEDLEENLQLAKVLIRHGADVDAQNRLMKTPVMNAVQARNCKMVEFLLQENAQVDATDKNGCTALLHATRRCGSSLRDGYDANNDKDLQLVRTLLKYDADANIKNNWNRFPLLMAVKNHNLPIVKLLLKNHASVNLLGPYNICAIYEALDQEKVYVDLVFELIKYNCEFNFLCPDLTPMRNYICKLWYADADELEKAKYVFKFFLFRRHTLTCYEFNLIKRISDQTCCGLSQFIQYCEIEVSQMRHDKLAPEYSVYYIALCGLYQAGQHVPLEVFDRLLDKLMDSAYPVYCDLIISGVCSPYLNKKFAEICKIAVGNVGTEFPSYDIFFFLSFYLSNLDMLNMMIACSDYN